MPGGPSASLDAGVQLDAYFRRRAQVPNPDDQRQSNCTPASSNRRATADEKIITVTKFRHMQLEM